MTTAAPPAVPERAPRCRYLKRSGNRCENPAADPDESAVQLCPQHALRAAQLLQDAGAIRIQYAPFTARRTA